MQTQRKDLSTLLKRKGGSSGIESAASAASRQPRYKGMFSGMALIVREEGIRVSVLSIPLRSTARATTNHHTRGQQKYSRYNLFFVGAKMWIGTVEGQHGSGISLSHIQRDPVLGLPTDKGLSQEIGRYVCSKGCCRKVHWICIVNSSDRNSGNGNRSSRRSAPQRLFDRCRIISCPVVRGRSQRRNNCHCLYLSF